MSFICSCKGMSRGTTPSFKFAINVPLFGTETKYMTFRQRGQIILEKTNADFIIVDEDTIKIKLTQAETLLFSHKYPIETQMRVKYADGAAVASVINEFYLEEIIKEGTI